VETKTQQICGILEKHSQQSALFTENQANNKKYTLR
jgi:hypothetical protein